MGRSRPYKQRLRIYVALIISALAVQLGQASARVCIVDLEIKGSALTLGGHVHEPVEAKLVPYGAAEASGVVSVALSSAGESCPPAAGELRAALAGAALVAPAGGRGVAFGSLRTSGPAAGASGVAVRGLKGALMSSARGPAEPLALSLSPRSGAATLASAAAAEPLDGTSFKGAGCALRASGGQLRLDCRELKLEGRLVGEGQISALLQISGSLTAAGKLADAKAAPSDLPPPLQSQATRRRALHAEAPPPALGARGCAAGAAVAANGSCACAAGWGGRDCSVCRENSVCPGFTGQPNSTCDANLTYGPTTSYKAYDCDLIGGLSKWVTGVAALCNVRGERLPFGYGPLGLKPGGLLTDLSAGPAANSFCKIEVGLVSAPERPLVCVASKCTFAVGASGFLCATTACSCGDGKCPSLIQSVVDNLANSTIGLTCDASGDGKCVLDGVTPRFSLQCRTGECTQPQEAARKLPDATDAGVFAQAQAQAQRAFPAIALVSALPIVLLLAIGALFLSHVLAARRLFAAGAAPAAPAAGLAEASAGDGKAVTLLAPQPSFALPTGDPDPATAFVFDNIVCSVPDRDAAPGATATGAAAAAAGAARLAAALRSTCGAAAGKAAGKPMRGPATPTPAPAVAPAVELAVADSGAAPAAAAAAFAGGRKVLLHGISGVVDEGEVLGVMGPSGSGKSTLLSILSGAVESVGAGARVDGAVSLGGERRRGALRRVTAFVPQKDVLLPALTVEECVRYSALLRLPGSLSPGEIQERIDGVLAELGLSHVATSLVGGSASIRGVSGGERRRVTIAMALVTRPRLVIMDEPTSGLDSFTAYNLMRTAQEIAMHDRVVIMSLHQPSPDMFDSLSQVLLLAKGRLAYLGTPASVGPHFAAAGLPVPRRRQPAEHMLHVASQPAGLAMLLAYAEKCGEARRRVAGLGAAAAAAANGAGAGAAASIAANLARLEQVSNSSTSSSPALLAMYGGAAAAAAAAAPPPPPPSSAPAVAAADAPDDACGGVCARAAAAARAAARECAVLYWRAFTNMRREPRLLMLHLLVALSLGLVVGAVFFKLENTQVGVQNRLGAMFFALALFGWTSVSVVDGLVLERELVEREVAGHYYRGGTYLLSSLVLDGLLLRTLPALLFSALVYPMVGLLPEVSRIVTFMFVLATYSCTVGALTTALTALCRTSSATTLAMNIILLMWVLVGGYLVNPMSIPPWLRWIRNLSPMSFAFEVLAANEMADQMYSLKVSGFAQLEGIKGDVFLRTLGLVPSRAFESALGLAGFYLGSVVLAFSATSFTLWRHGGGSTRRALQRLAAALLCRGGRGTAAQ